MSGSPGAHLIGPPSEAASPWSEVATATDPIRLDPEFLVRTFPGPALHIDHEGAVLVANAAAAPLTAQLSQPQGAALREAIRDAAVDGGAVKLRAQARAGEEWRTYDLTFLPTIGRTAGTGEVLIIGRDVTLEHNFTTALVASRQLFKDLVTCSADFAWETDAEGDFTFISPAGALGHAAADLVGSNFRELIDLEAAAEQELPFACRAPQNNRELWLRDAEAELACILVSSVPVETKAGEWRGARGVCSDVTQLRRQEAALKRARQRERLMHEVVDVIRTEVAPETMFATAVDAVAEVMEAANCWVMRRSENGALTIAAAHRQGSGRVNDEAGLLATLDGLPVDGPAVQVLNMSDGDGRVLVTACDYQDRRLGYLCLAGPSGSESWIEEDVGLVAGVADQLGIAMAQAAVQEELAHLSRTDDLTGLMNRRALEAELVKRLHEVRRSGRYGALMYLDLDNFKAANDTHGHSVGDTALREFAQLLQESVRKGDLAARIGGGEFVVWLDGAEAESALVKARSLIVASSSLNHYSGDEARPLTVSIGVAAVAPEDDCDLRDLMRRVDGAMYEAKRGGKNRAALAVQSDSEDGETEC